MLHAIIAASAGKQCRTGFSPSVFVQNYKIKTKQGALPDVQGEKPVLVLPQLKN